MFRRLSKICFPHLPVDQRQRRVNTLILVAALAGAVAVVVAVAMIYLGKSRFGRFI